MTEYMKKQFSDLTLAEKKKLIKLKPDEIKALLKELGDVVEDPKSTPKEVNDAVTKIEEVKAIKETPKLITCKKCGAVHPEGDDCFVPKDEPKTDPPGTLEMERYRSFKIW